ncbi:MAG: hypothetical protein HYT62_03235 [Candidatus Yanofskybacteria bacterium]|nr:hypothetical protein [Candidatus Yanofskybacteria bacterium]
MWILSFVLICAILISFLYGAANSLRGIVLISRISNLSEKDFLEEYVAGNYFVKSCFYGLLASVVSAIVSLINGYDHLLGMTIVWIVIFSIFYVVSRRVWKNTKEKLDKIELILR